MLKNQTFMLSRFDEYNRICGKCCYRVIRIYLTHADMQSNFFLSCKVDRLICFLFLTGMTSQYWLCNSFSESFHFKTPRYTKQMEHHCLFILTFKHRQNTFRTNANPTTVRVVLLSTSGRSLSLINLIVLFFGVHLYFA